MSESLEPIKIESGEVLWPVIAFNGLRYLRSVDAQVLAVKESNPETRRALADAVYFPDEDEFPEYA